VYSDARVPTIELGREHWERLKPLLTRALRLPPDKRAAYFAANLGSDVPLQSCAIEMLRLYDRTSTSVPAGRDEVPTSSDGTPLWGPPLDPGTSVGHYRIIRKLGEGGMGRVYLAEDTRLGRRVALKLLDRSVTETLGGSHARAVAESRSIAVLNHPGIVVLYDVFEHNRELILVMEHVEGRRLSEHIAAGPVPTAFALRLIEQVADALAYAHAHGVLHCDLKPSNIHVLPTGATKILDFGLARIVTATDPADEPRSPRVVGTPGYLSPEQLCFKPPTAASDVYSLGVVSFELLTGMLPFKRDDEGQLLFDTITAPPPLASSIVPGLPPAVDDLVSRCLAKDPRERLQAHEIVRTLRSSGPLADRASHPMDAGAVGAAGGSSPRASGFRGRGLVAVGASAMLALALWAATHLGDSWSVGWPWASSPVISVQALPVSLAILPTTGALKSTQDTATGKALPALLRPALSRIEGLNVMLLDDEPVAGDVPPQRAMQKLGATWAIRCLLTTRDGTDLVQVELLSTNGTDQLLHAGVPFDGQNPARTFEQVFAAAERGLAARLPRPRSTPERTPASGLVPSPLALNHFTEGLAMLERMDVPGNVERAITLLESATEKDPTSAIAHAALARARWVHYDDTRSEESARKAQASAMTALSLDNSLVSVKLSTAIIQRGMGELAAAENTLADVIRSAPASDEAHRLMGEVLAARGQLARALKELETAISLRPLYWRNHRSKGIAYYEAGDFEKAASSFIRVTELQPDGAWGYQMLGAALHQQGSYKDAVAAYETALKLGSPAAAWSNIGKLHYDNGQYDKAVHAYREALKIRSGSALTWRNLGDVLVVMGRGAEAREAYERAEELAIRTMRINPSDAGALSMLGVIHAKLGRAREARSEAEKASVLAPKDRMVHYRRAVVLMLTGDRPAAQAAIDDAIRLGFSVSEARLDRDLHGLKFENP
jgi:eukaryotic-like serine/threonine-protein kinase